MVFTLTAFRAKTLFAPLVLGMALFAAPAGASTGDEAKAFVEDVSQQAIDIISDKVSQAGSSGASLAGVTSASTSFTVSHR